MALKKITLLGALLLIVLATVASVTPTQAQSGAFIRVIHAAPEAPAVDVYLDYATEPAIKNLAFGAATDFILVPAKYYSVQIRAAGAPSSTLPVYATRFTLYANRSVNVVALGTLGAKGDQAFKLGFYLLDRTGTLGGARIQVIHASPDTPAVDFQVNGKTVLRQASFGRTPPPSIATGVGAYDLAVVPAGTTGPALISLKGVNLRPNVIYTVVAIGRQGNIRPLILTTTGVLPALPVEPTAQP